MMNWRIPAGIFAAVAVLSGALHALDPQSYASPGFMLFSGGLMLGPSSWPATWSALR